MSDLTEIFALLDNVPLKERGTYTLKLVPMIGVTIPEHTWREWNADTTFRVVSTDAVKYRRGELIRKSELEADQAYHDISYNVTFDTQDFADHVADSLAYDGKRREEVGKYIRISPEKRNSYLFQLRARVRKTYADQPDVVEEVIKQMESQCDSELMATWRLWK